MLKRSLTSLIWHCHAAVSKFMKQLVVTFKIIGYSSETAGKQAETHEAMTTLAQQPMPLVKEEVEMILEHISLALCGESEDDDILYRDEDVEQAWSDARVLETGDEVKMSFEVFDENGDGFIDCGELRSVLCKIGFEGFSEMDCGEMISKFDEDGDGLIGIHEFEKVLGFGSKGFV
uniref:EF-hand domain-containing protein n=1 Tax=Kalanchoe fedtschenkoi TaxID=63787 RepID=A0A7N0TNH5_KALFE